MNNMYDYTNVVQNDTEYDHTELGYWKTQTAARSKGIHLFICIAVLTLLLFSKLKLPTQLDAQLRNQM